VLPEIRKIVAWFQDSQTSCACPDKNITKIKVNRSMNGLILKEENRNARTFVSVVYSTSVPTSQTTQSVSIIKTNRLMLLRGVIRQGIEKSKHNGFMYVYSGVNKTTCFGLLGGHLQVLQVLAIGD
jgi:hypothetical protein